MARVLRALALAACAAAAATSATSSALHATLTHDGCTATLRLHVAADATTTGTGVLALRDGKEVVLECGAASMTPCGPATSTTLALHGAASELHVLALTLRAAAASAPASASAVRVGNWTLPAAAPGCAVTPHAPPPRTASSGPMVGLLYEGWQARRQRVARRGGHGRHAAVH